MAEQRRLKSKEDPINPKTEARDCDRFGHRLIKSFNLLYAGKLASLNCSWQSKEGTYRALGMTGIEPTPSKSEWDWTPLSP